MASFKPTVITNKGHALMAKIATGTTKMTFTKIRTSSSSPADNTLADLTSLTDIKQTFDVSDISKINNNTIKVSASISNAELSTGYNLNIIGLYANDPDEGEILYSVTKAETADWMPPDNGLNVASLLVNLIVATSNTDNVTIEINPITVASIQNVMELSDKIIDIKGFIGYPDKGILGIEWDVHNKTTKRLSDAIGRNAGEDFDGFKMFGNRKRCNLTDDGIVTAYHGDDAYTETGALTISVEIDNVTYNVGTPVQVMVEQPVFWYKTVPITFKTIEGQEGLSLNKVRYYISETQRPGFKRHPAFFTREQNPQPLDKIYLSAYEGCLFDVSAGVYLLNDEQIGDLTAGTGDKLSSIANAKPVSGLTQDYTRAKARRTANNRGVGWQLEDIFTNSMSQLLFAIEYGSFDTQARIGKGVVNKATGSGNESELTGATAFLGNISGRQAGTDGLTSVSYRGQENFWGNIWKWEDGINIYANGTGNPNDCYIATHTFTDSKITEQYKNVGFQLVNKEGYISSIGWTEEFDWAFLATEANGANNKPIEDYFYGANSSSGYRVSLLAGPWNDGLYAGGFSRHVNNNPSTRTRNRGGRVCFVPILN